MSKVICIGDFENFLESVPCRYYEGGLWYRGKDVCAWLGFKSPQDAMNIHCVFTTFKSYKTAPKYITTESAYRLFDRSKYNIGIIDGEEWKPVDGFEHLYLVSNWGRMWSIRQERIMKEGISGSGYKQVHLYDEQKNRRCEFTHRMVAQSFVENPYPEKYRCVDHVDNCKDNNCSSNLVWCDYEYNNRKAVASFKSGMLKFNKEEILSIRNQGDDSSIQILCDQYKVTPQTIRNIVQKKSYVEVK